MDIRIVQKLTLPLMLMSLLTLAACTPLKLNPPSPEIQSVLVLPVTHTNKAVAYRPGFYYVYQITSDDNQVAPYDAVIKFPTQKDMLIVDALPPGSYRVSKLSIFPVGAGDHTYGDNSRSRNDPFTLAPGMITIFPKSFNLLTYNAIPGRGATTTYAYDIEQVTDEQRQQILNTLAGLANFQSWEVLDTGNKFVARAQGNWNGSWQSTGADDCGSGELHVKVLGSKLSGSGVSAGGESLTLAANINHQGKITGELSNSQGLLAKVSAGLFWGGEIVGKFHYLDGCEGQWNVLKNP
jgi:hypothetical protein